MLMRGSLLCRGALNRVSPSATAFPHRSSLAVIQFYTNWQGADREEASLAWINAAYTAVSQHVGSSAAYENYIDADLGSASAGIYFAGNVARLQATKAKWDPESFFGYANSIAPA